MTITKIADGSKLTIALDGLLDTVTAPDLEQELKSSLDGVTALTFDFENLEYISSAGLRVLLLAQKTMTRQGEMKVVHPAVIVMEVFEATGFNEMLTIE